MNNEFNDVDLSVSIKRLWHIIWHRKYWILSIYFVVICIALYITFTASKLYISQALLLINKASSTNLSEINPFLVSGSSTKGGTIINIGGETLDSEIEILKSPLVLDKVIRDNNLKYEDGSKRGDYLLADHFLSDNLKIEIVPKTNIIKVSYTSTSPKKSYDILSSLIRNYKDTYENINFHKATKDREFLEITYQEAKKDFDSKIKGLKEHDNDDNEVLVNPDISSFQYEVLARNDKRIQQTIKNAPGLTLGGKKNQIELDQAISKLQMLKERYEWSKLVEQMSKNASNVVVLKEPRVLEEHEFVTQNLILNIIFALVISFTISCVVVYAVEKADSKISFFDYSTTIELLNCHNLNFTSLLITLEAKNLDKCLLVSLASEKMTQKFVDQLKSDLMRDDFHLDVITSQKSINNIIRSIGQTENVILLSEFKLSDRGLFYKLRDIIKEFKKELLGEFILYK